MAIVEGLALMLAFLGFLLAVAVEHKLPRPRFHVRKARPTHETSSAPSTSAAE